MASCRSSPRASLRNAMMTGNCGRRGCGSERKPTVGELADAGGGLTLVQKPEFCNSFVFLGICVEVKRVSSCGWPG